MIKLLASGDAIAVEAYDFDTKVGIAIRQEVGGLPRRLAARLTPNEAKQIAARLSELAFMAQRNENRIAKEDSNG